MTDVAREIEIKLSGASEALARAARQRLLRGEARPVTRRLYSIYFDTPERDLWQRGVTLRLRRERVNVVEEGEGHAPRVRWLQTVKGGGAARAGLHERLEFESELPGPHPDLARIPYNPLTAIFTSPQLAARIEPVFITDVRRSQRLIAPASDVTVEVCVDRGVIRAGKRSEPLAEIELELKSGATADLVAFARQLVATMPLSLDNRSKAERGYALAAGERYGPVKARTAALTPDMTVVAAFRAVVGGTLAHLQANERGMLDARDPEFLHQMRVALRRMRSMVGVFAAALPEAVVDPIVTELRWLARALGPARDWDVFVTETLAPVRREFSPHPGFSELARRCERARRAALYRARRAVNSARYRRLVLDIGAVLADDAWTSALNEKQLGMASAPALQFAVEVLSQRYARARRRGRKLATLSAARLHRLRIAVKKLRYAADAFAGLFDPTAAGELLSCLGRLQDILGSISDVAAAGELLDSCSGAPRTQALVEARGIVRGWGHARMETQRRELRGAWKAFRAAGKFW